MGAVLPTAPVQAIVAVLAASPSLLAQARAAITAEIAPIALASTESEWTESDYYRAEMGAALWRQYLALDDLMAASDLAELKLRTNAMEQRWRSAQGRTVNLDPGYLDLLRVVLASTKDAAHRIVIGAGIYAEAALHFVHGCFEPWPYTYPDYAGAAAIGFFNSVRERWRGERMLKAQSWDGRARWRSGSAPKE